MSLVIRKPTFWFSTRSDTNGAVQSQKMARGLKFRFKKEEGLYYLCSENKGVDQLCKNRMCKMLFLAHLSRRLRGELIVYRSSRRPSVRAWVCSHFQT